jgi:hypothetical protein
MAQGLWKPTGNEVFSGNPLERIARSVDCKNTGGHSPGEVLNEGAREMVMACARCGTAYSQRYETQAPEAKEEYGNLREAM